MCQRILILLSILISMGNVGALHINCNGKGFYCQNSTNFYVCVDMGGGFTMTMDDVEQRCPDNTYCDNMNPFECMEITTTTTTTPKSTEASVLTLQWPPSYLSNLGIAPATVQQNPASPIVQSPPIFSPIAPVAPPPFDSFLKPAVPSAALPGTKIVKEEYADNYLKFLPIIKRDTIETVPGTEPPYAEGGNNPSFDDATIILPLTSIISNPLSTLLESSPQEPSNATEEILGKNSTTLSTSYSTLENKPNASIPYSIPIDEYTYPRDSTTISPPQTQSTTSIPSIQDFVTSTTESYMPTSTLPSTTTELDANSTILVITDVINLNSTIPDSENNTENLLNSTTEYPPSSTPLDSLSTVQSLLTSTTEYPLSSTTFDSLSTEKNMFNPTTEFPISSILQESLSTVQGLYNSTTENPLDTLSLDSTSTTENPLNSTSLDSTPTIQNAFISTWTIPITTNKTLYNSTTLDLTLSNVTNENQYEPTIWVPISTTINLFDETSENPLTDIPQSTTDIPQKFSTLDSIATTLTPLNSTDNTSNSSTPNLVLSTESSILNSTESPYHSEPSSPSITKFNVTIDNIPEILNLTEQNLILDVTGFETTTVQSYIVGSVLQEKDSGNSTENAFPLTPKVANFSSNSLPDVPLTPDHAISTRMIQTTEMFPFNNRVAGFVPGNIANTGVYPSIAPPLSIPLPIPNDPNAYNSCQRPGQYPDENSCHSYYMCNNNVRYKLVCPYNMVYSPSLQKCTTAKDHCSNYNDFTCNQVGRFPDSRSCYSYYDCQPNGAGFTASRVHCPWYSSFQPNNGQCVTNNNACGCQQTPQTCRYPQQVPMDYQGGQSTPFTYYPDNPVTHGREYGYPPVSSSNFPVNVPIVASTPYPGDRFLPADRVAIYNRENALPADPSNTYNDRDYIREKLPVGVNYPNFGDNVVPSVDRTPTYVRDSAPGAINNGYIKDYTPIVGNTPYVPENTIPVGGTNTYYQNNIPADQSNTYYQNNVPGENTFTYNDNVVAPVDSANNKNIPAKVERPNPSYIRDNIVPTNYNSGFNYYPAVEATNRLAGTNNNFGDRTRWSQPDPNNEAPGRWTPNYYGSWFN